ncbi:hypothetical protein ATANTOWER_023131 [Ataeniobius toweri]|uniref:Uncharacterized protein n=1 Tax=Ataeniobius toweri TaxID=208326 RepID=A0ABU7A973_9TELE|nr:hypothetical protein [Ataeniobius toweri]
MTTHLPIISISFHKNSGNRIGKLLRPVWHLLASSRNPLPPCGRLCQLWQTVAVRQAVAAPVAAPADCGSSRGSSHEPISRGNDKRYPKNVWTVGISRDR